MRPKLESGVFSHMKNMISLHRGLSKSLKLNLVDYYLVNYTKALVEMLQPIKALTHTITSDNGKEFAYHEQVAQSLDADFYFANPYHSWERGLNEHTNGLIRQYLPKQTNFTQVKRKQIRFIQDRLNNRPRKSLGFKTPAQVFYARVSKVMAA